MAEELELRGFKSAKAAEEILSMTKLEFVLRYMSDLFTDITSFGKCCFQAKIKRGITALKEVAFVNLSLLEGDNKHLNYVSGTSSTCSDRNCRRCMSDRNFRFMVEDAKCETG